MTLMSSLGPNVESDHINNKLQNNQPVLDYDKLNEIHNIMKNSNTSNSLM